MALSRRERQEQRRKLWKEKRLDLAETAEKDAFFQKKEYKGLLGIYDRHYLKLLLIPLAIFLTALFLFTYQIATTGDFINKGISLKGGLVITIPLNDPIDIVDLEGKLHSEFKNAEIDVRSATELGVQKSVIIATDDPNLEKQILEIAAQKIPDAQKSYSSETTGSTLGGSFFKETTKAMVIAFLFMGIVVLISFRSLAPSVMVIFCVFADIIETIVAVNLLGLKISTAGIAAFLMLIGYSVDTDILLTSRVLKGKEGTVFQRTINAAKTGLMMTATALIAVIISLLLTHNETIREIMIILLVGLFFDILNTWVQNTALLRYYLEKIMPKKHARAQEREHKKKMQIYNDSKHVGTKSQTGTENETDGSDDDEDDILDEAADDKKTIEDIKQKNEGPEGQDRPDTDQKLGK